MANILLVLFAHFWSDYALQGSYVAKNKCDTKFMMFYHCFLYSIIVSLSLWMSYNIGFWSLPILFITHWIIDDTVKCNTKFASWFGKQCSYLKWIDWFDLLSHLIVIMAIIVLGAL